MHNSASRGHACTTAYTDTQREREAGQRLLQNVPAEACLLRSCVVPSICVFDICIKQRTLHECLRKLFGWCVCKRTCTCCSGCCFSGANQFPFLSSSSYYPSFLFLSSNSLSGISELVSLFFLACCHSAGTYLIFKNSFLIIVS